MGRAGRGEGNEQLIGRSSQRPLLLLDVDGTLLVSPRDRETLGPQKNERPLAAFKEIFADGRNYLIVPAVADALPSLCQRFEVLWLTAWREKVRELEVLFSLPRLESIDYATLTDGGTSVYDKLKAVEMSIGNQPLIWIEDSHVPDTRRFAEQRTADGIPTLALQTMFWDGCGEEHLQAIERFLAALRNDQATEAFCCPPVS